MEQQQGIVIMTVFEAIHGRSSAKKFSDEAPKKSVIEQILAAGSRAPDHGLLAPWRFTVLSGEGRQVLADAMGRALLDRVPQADADMQARESSKAFRSPILIVVSAAVASHPKVPEVEQLVAVGAAIQNMWLMARELGLGMAWKTGSHAYHPLVKQALGLGATEQVIGFMHLGKVLQSATVRPADYAGKTRWLGEISD